MARRDFKDWFLVELCEGVWPTYIVNAGSEVEALECFDTVTKGVAVQRLTWERLCELTGCVMPSIRKDSEFANGDLMFVHNSRAFIMTAAMKGE